MPRGDGWKFRGRGLIQVTGRANYKAAAAQYGKLYGDAVDFEADPDKMEDFPYTVRSAVCFWIEHGLQYLADKPPASQCLSPLLIQHRETGEDARGRI